MQRNLGIMERGSKNLIWWPTKASSLAELKRFLGVYYGSEHSYQEKGVEFRVIPVPHSCRTIVWVMLLSALSLDLAAMASFLMA
jgi:hypothetical protein